MAKHGQAHTRVAENTGQIACLAEHNFKISIQIEKNTVFLIIYYCFYRSNKNYSGQAYKKVAEFIVRLVGQLPKKVADVIIWWVRYKLR